MEVHDRDSSEDEDHIYSRTGPQRTFFLNISGREVLTPENIPLIDILALEGQLLISKNKQIPYPY